MDLKKVQSGDKLKIPASTYNAFIDAAQAVKDNNNFLSATNKNSDSRKVIVQNNSGGNLDKFEILGISAPYVTPTDNETDFQNRITIVGVTPDIDDHKGKFIVLQEPIPNGKIGRGILSGETIVQIDVDDEAHEFAEITDGESGYLTSTDSGSARILWKESGTGQVWAYVRIGDSVGGGFGTLDNPDDYSYTGEHTEAAISGTAFDRENPTEGTDGYKFTCITGVAYYHASDQILYCYAQDLTFDSNGMLALASDERRVTVDVPVVY